MSSDKKTETKVYLKIHEFDCPVDELTALIGIPPTKTGQKGDLLPNRNIEIRRKFSSWILQSSADIHATVEEHIDTLIHTITPRLAVLKEVIATANGELTIVVKARSEYNVGAYIAKEKLRVFLDLGVSLDMDIYFLE